MASEQLQRAANGHMYLILSKLLQQAQILEIMHTARIGDRDFPPLYTTVELTEQTLDELSEYCDEFLIHAVDVEGRAEGIEVHLAELLGKWGKIPVTYVTIR